MLVRALTAGAKPRLRHLGAACSTEGLTPSFHGPRPKLKVGVFWMVSGQLNWRAAMAGSEGRLPLRHSSFREEDSQLN